MARKPSLKNASKPKKPPKVTVDEVPMGLNLVAAHLVDIKNALVALVEETQKRNALVAESVTSQKSPAAQPSPEAGKDVVIPGGIVRRRGRPTNAEREARAAAEPAGEVPTPVAEEPKPKKVDKTTCTHPSRQDIPGTPFERCTLCGTVLDKPVAAAPAPAPAPAAAPPSLDDIRAVAIQFAGKHGKEKLSDLLKKFGADKLSSVPEDKRAALLASLQVE